MGSSQRFTFIHVVILITIKQLCWRQRHCCSPAACYVTTRNACGTFFQITNWGFFLLDLWALKVSEHPCFFVEQTRKHRWNKDEIFLTCWEYFIFVNILTFGCKNRYFPWYLHEICVFSTLTSILMAHHFFNVEALPKPTWMSKNLQDEASLLYASAYSASRCKH